jgi:hypothetical protein
MIKVLGVSFLEQETIHDGSSVLVPIAAERPSDAPSAPRSEENVTKSKLRPQQADPATQPLRRETSRIPPGREIQEEHLAIALHAYETFETRGCERGHDWDDWFRAESELHLNQ